VEIPSDRLKVIQRRWILALREVRSQWQIVPRSNEPRVSRCDNAAIVRRGEQERIVAKANSKVRNDFVSRGNEIKRGAGDENRTRVLSLGSS
jgi:hypothetical protein